MAEYLDPNARFTRYEQQAKQQASNEKIAAQEAIKRRLMQQGLQGSGVGFKQQQIAENQIGQQLGQRLGDIQSAREQEQLKQQEIKQAREYQTGEREAAQKFAAEQATSQQEFAKAERMASQDYATQQWQKQADFEKSMNSEKMQMAKEQFDKNMELAWKQYGLEADAQEFNKAISTEQLNEPGFIGQIADDIGGMFGGRRTKSYSGGKIVTSGTPGGIFGNAGKKKSKWGF